MLQLCILSKVSATQCLLAAYLQLLVEGPDGGDPGCDDCQEGGCNDGHGALNGAQAYQKRLRQPTSTCTPHSTRRSEFCTSRLLQEKQKFSALHLFYAWSITKIREQNQQQA